jgi:hypothetical protein
LLSIPPVGRVPVIGSGIAEFQGIESELAYEIVPPVKTGKGITWVVSL